VTTKQVQVRRIPADVHRRFKAACAARGVSMERVLVAFMKSYPRNEPKSTGRRPDVR